MSYKVTVIVPIYNVEAYIERCARSLFEQTMESLEFIFVNDCTPDCSMQLLEKIISEYPGRRHDIHCVSHSQNRGLPSARNSGLAIATGEYIFHCDSDDWVDADMLTKMYNAAKKQEADIVYADWYLSFPKNERYMHQPSLDTPFDCLRAILEGKLRFNVWNKLVKRRLYVENQICFPDGRGMGEDMTMIKLFCHAERVTYLKGAFYHYVQTNINSFTKSWSDKHLEQVYSNTKEVVSYVERNGKNDISEKEIHFFKLNVKLPLLISSQHKMYDIWQQWFPESNSYIKQNSSFSFRIRTLQYIAIKRWYWLLRLHYYGVVKIVYGIFYR